MFGKGFSQPDRKESMYQIHLPMFKKCTKISVVLDIGIKTAELLNKDRSFQPNLKLVNFSERIRFYAKMRMASRHLNKLHFACLALHPNTVSQRHFK